MARQAYSIGSAPVKSLIVTLHGMGLIAFAAQVYKIAAPEAMQIIAITVNVGARGGTHVTSTLDVLSGATSLLAALFNVASLTPGTPVEKLPAVLSATGQATIAKDAVLSITAAESGGTNPTVAAVTVQIDYVPAA